VGARLLAKALDQTLYMRDQQWPLREQARSHRIFTDPPTFHSDFRTPIPNVFGIPDTKFPLRPPYLKNPYKFQSLA
jgi:hypothetical protein